jgi:hypothetical protein
MLQRERRGLQRLSRARPVVFLLGMHSMGNLPLLHSHSTATLGRVSPLSKRLVLSWIASDVLWAALFIWVQKREKD